jgi:hypothetical protein
MGLVICRIPMAHDPTVTSSSASASPPRIARVRSCGQFWSGTSAHLLAVVKCRRPILRFRSRRRVNQRQGGYKAGVFLRQSQGENRCQ